MKIPIQNPKFLLLSIPTITLTALILYIAAATILQDPTTFEPKLTESEVTSALCNVAPYPKSCFSSLQKGGTTLDPQYLFQASLRVSQNELNKISSLPQKLITNVNEARVTVALFDCQSSFADAVAKVNVSLSLAEKWIPREKMMLSRWKINNIIKWLTSALTDLQGCLDGLHESFLHDEMVVRTRYAREYTSNSLAIAGQMEKILRKLHISMY